MPNAWTASEANDDHDETDDVSRRFVCVVVVLYAVLVLLVWWVLHR